MNQIWSTGRLAYMTNVEKLAGCVFCNALHQEDGPENLIITRGKFSFVILNRYSYTSGHLMVIPLEHRATLEELSSETRFEIMELTTLAARMLKMVYKPIVQGFFCKLGQEIPMVF